MRPVRQRADGPRGRKDATAQADGRNVGCESPERWTVNRPPSAFSHSRTATCGSARTSANALQSVSPPDRGSGPWRRRPSTSTPSSRIGFRRSWPPPLPRRRRGVPGQDHQTDCTHGPSGHRQPLSRRDRASTPFPWLDHPPRGCRVPRPEARKPGVFLPLRGSNSCVTGDPAVSDSAKRPPKRPEWPRERVSGLCGVKARMSSTQSARGPPTGG